MKVSQWNTKRATKILWISFFGGACAVVGQFAPIFILGAYFSGCIVFCGGVSQICAAIRGNED